MKRMPRPWTTARSLAALAAVACAGCGDAGVTSSTSGGSDACAPFLGNWAGTLNYSWVGFAGAASGSAVLHVTFTAQSCGPTYADLNMQQVNFSAGTIDNSAYGSFSTGVFHAPIKLPATAPSGSATWDWFLNFQNGSVSTSSQSQPLPTFNATGTQVTMNRWNDPGFLKGKAGGIPDNSTVTAGSLELHHL